MSGTLNSELAEMASRLAPVFREASALRVLVFGSFARGTQTKRSDLDLLIVKETDRRFFDRYDTILTDLHRAIPGRGIDVLIYTPAELEAIRERSFIQSILSEGVWIYES